MMALAELDVMPRLDKAHQSVLRATPPDFLDLSEIPKMRRATALKEAANHGQGPRRVTQRCHQIVPAMRSSVRWPSS